MLDEDHDTVPHALRELLPPAEVPDAEVRFGDTVARVSVTRPELVVPPAPPARQLPPAQQAPAHPLTSPAPPEVPPMPSALRPHHRLKVAGAEPIELDHPVRLGRAPRARRVPAGESPRLVAVASPDGGISASHLELREQGGVVVATDLRTLNGSEVRTPGSPTRTLLHGESLVVPSGTHIDLGEGVVVEVLAPHPAASREEGRA